MKTKLIIGAAIVAIAAVTHAQSTIIITQTTGTNGVITDTTNTPAPPAQAGGLILLGENILHNLATASNWAIVPYASYRLNNDKTGHKFGGGILALYNFNQYVGTGIGLDEMGSLSVVSANVQLELPLQPLAFMGTNTFEKTFTMTPFIYSGLGTPLGGTGTSGVVTHEGEGINVDLFSLWGGKFGMGTAYIQRQGAGKYSGNYVNPFVQWHRGSDASFYASDTVAETDDYHDYAVYSSR